MPTADSRFTEAQLRLRGMRRAAFGKAVSAARNRAGLTQTELAQASGLSRPTISRIELGTASISSDRLWDLAFACGTTPADLFQEAQQHDGLESPTAT